MSSESDQTGQWERIARELRACKESQRQAWGDIDNTTLGRYLAGDASGHELASVENALEELPELRKLTDLVRDVLDNLEPFVLDAPAVAATPEPVLLPFPAKPAPTFRKRFFTFLRQRSSLVAAACLLLIFGLAMPRPGFLSAPPTGETPLLTRAVASRTDQVVSVRQPAENRDDVLSRVSASLSAVGAGGSLGELGQPRVSDPLARADTASPSPLMHLGAVEFHRNLAEAGSRGELAKAVPQLHKAHQAYQLRLGRNHPATKQTGRTLAGYYQVALNAAPSFPRGAGAAPLRPADRPSLSGKAPGAAGEGYLTAALALRDQITNRTTQEVQTAVVPVLTEALRTATNSQDRMDFVRAIAALGPAAGNAVSVLTERLESSDDPNEVRAVLKALDELGPAAREAVPTLVAMCRECGRDAATPKMAKDADKRGKGKGVARNRRLTAGEGKLAEAAVASLNSPEGRSGIDDQAGCFSVRSLNQSTRAIREAARKAGVEVLFSTACSATAARKESKKDEWKASRLHAMGKRAIHVVFDRQGTVVEVHVSDALRRAGVTAEGIRKCLVERVRQQQYDKALDESIKFVANIAAKKK